MKRLWPYLLLNVVISAATMLIVLLIWNASHRPAAVETTSATSHPLVTPAPTSTLPPLDKVLLQVDSVIGNGDPASEYIHISYLGEGEIDLKGWKVMNGNREIFTFPSFVLYKDGAFDLYSRTGTNTAIDLYINSVQPIWKPGETLTIVDPAGQTRLSYTIP
jgi:hypothetical protein